MTPVICLITDRRRLAGASERALVDQVAAAARAGVHLIQIRERDLEARALAHLASAAVEAVRGTAARVLVNDLVDVALAAGAHGVHLRADSVSADRVRRLAPPGFVIGRSVHALDEARRVAATGGLDYLLFGTVFETASKPGIRPAGVDALRAVAAATVLPVLAVGGVTPGRFHDAAQAGAAGCAAIGLFANLAPEDLQVVVAEASLAFDTLPRVP